MKPRHDFVWLASFPRSGNTFLRTILWNCFGLKSGSIYPNDLGGNRHLERTTGHIEHAGNTISFPTTQKIHLLKTHERASDSRPAIYVVRNGQEATLSLWEFYDRKIPLDVLIRGNHQFGTWSDNLLSWQYPTRPNTLFLRYEDLVAQTEQSLEDISVFLQSEIIQKEVPARAAIAKTDGRWVRNAGEKNPNHMTDDLSALFREVNATGLKLTNY